MSLISFPVLGKKRTLEAVDFLCMSHLIAVLVEIASVLTNVSKMVGRDPKVGCSILLLGLLFELYLVLEKTIFVRCSFQTLFHQNYWSESKGVFTLQLLLHVTGQLDTWANATLFTTHDAAVCISLKKK